MTKTDPVIRCPQGILEIEMDGATHAVFNASVPSAHTLDNVMEPDYFGYEITSSNVRQGDEIKVRAQDGSFFAFLMVRYVDKAMAKVGTREMLSKEFPDEAEFPPGWGAEYRGTAGEWVIICGGEDREEGLANVDAAAQRAWVLSGKEQRAARKKPAPNKRAGNIEKKPAAKKPAAKKAEETAAA